MTIHNFIALRSLFIYVHLWDPFYTTTTRIRFVTNSFYLNNEIWTSDAENYSLVQLCWMFRFIVQLILLHCGCIGYKMYSQWRWENVHDRMHLLKLFRSFFRLAVRGHKTFAVFVDTHYLSLVTYYPSPQKICDCLFYVVMWCFV